MRTIGFGVLAVLLLAYAAFAVPVMLRFNKYCSRVAAATGRSRENHSLKPVSDGGFNAFQQRLWWALTSGDYKGLRDQQLVNEGHALSRSLRLMCIFAVALVVLFAGLDLATK